MKKKKQTLLWKIEGKKISGNAYVFGTMHVKDRRAFGFKEQVEQAILQCDSFASEFNLEEANHNLTATSMDLPNGQTLEDLISPKKYKKIKKVFFKQTSLDLDLLKHSKPMVVFNILSEAILSSDMQDSLDVYLWKFAKENEKVTLGIETLEEQLAIMEKISIEYQLKSLLTIAKSFKKFRKQTLKLTEYYENGQVQELYKASKKSLGPMRNIILYDRNYIMADRIAKLCQEQSIFTTIGAGHLPGKKGVLRLLKGKGFKVKPISLSK